MWIFHSGGSLSLEALGLRDQVKIGSDGKGGPASCLIEAPFKFKAASNEERVLGDLRRVEGCSLVQGCPERLMLEPFWQSHACAATEAAFSSLAMRARLLWLSASALQSSIHVERLGA